MQQYGSFIIFTPGPISAPDENFPTESVLLYSDT